MPHNWALRRPDPLNRKHLTLAHSTGCVRLFAALAGDSRTLTFIADATLEDLPAPAHLGQTRVGGIDLNQLRTRRVLESVLSLSTSPTGFTASDVATRTKQLGGPSEYTSRQAAYDIRKLRAKRLLKKLGKSRRYQPTAEGLRAIAVLVVLRDKVIQPLLAANLQTKRGRKPKNRTPIDEHYDRVRSEMKDLFQALGIAA